jgi:predicted Rossmann-fold nucleotide-binding protein
LAGGFGTLDDAFEAATLIQTRKILDFPVIFVGVEYWQPLFDFMRDRLLDAKTIAADDLERIVLTDSVERVLECLEGCPGYPKRKVDPKTAAT